MADFATARGMAASQSAATTDVLRHTLGGISRSSSRQPSSKSAVAAPAAINRLEYLSTPATMQAALSAYLARARRADPTAADAAGRTLVGQDISRIYRTIVGPFGLRDRNAADAYTAYVVLGWMIANDGANPSPATVRAVRDQLAVRVVSDPALARYSPAALGEEFKLSFVILHSGWQSARRQGGLNQFADGVVQMFERQGLGLRAVRLTPAGFEPR
ncbi:MAG: hypothetical protein JF628_07365 [Sphingomonas sp.]|nr:hypothetical protein [Sphingomonas sp.]